MSNAVTKACVHCSKKFETSKFTPYVLSCPVCKAKGLAGPIKKKTVEHKVEKDMGKSAKATKPGVKARRAEPSSVLAVVAPPAPKVYHAVENKEAIFAHLLGKGYKLSGMNTPYKIYPKIKVMCPLSDMYTKIIVNYLHDDGKFDGSNILMSKKDVKDLPAEVKGDLAEVLGLIYPEETK